RWGVRSFIQARWPCAMPQSKPRDREPLRTPDGRYLIVRDRLWRTSNPDLSVEQREALVQQLMQARRAVKTAREADDAVALRAARNAVNEAKIGLGERGPVWWTDGTKDYNRHLVKNTPYAEWYAGLGKGPADNCL